MAQTAISSIKSNYDNLNNTEKRIADTIIANPTIAHDFTIQELAVASNVSSASVSRFVKHIGWDSYRDFSVALASHEDSNVFFGEIAETDSTKDIIQKVFSGATNALTTTLEMLDTTTFTAAVDLICNAKTVGLFGIGGSSLVAFNGYHKLLRTSINVQQHPDYDIQLMQAVRMTKQDVGIVISHSGRNHDTLTIAEKLKENNVKTIAITSFAQSPLAKLADISLVSIAEEVNFRAESMSSLIAQLTIMDSLFTAVGFQLGSKTQVVVDNIRNAIEKTRVSK
ncbi:MurR/RpiR family transcriptional regulator [Periweissella beninensis]|uniref:MurR/RpiR family transcriptional regulator n=1 Tax=Periweissella beninensis TaxID=504936 RepID=A0ABT0VK00_9LACO|nr:MurR/RpiR family transcriptional regulator [Periweissella beninensis]MBM7543976.1 RpiR family carbohydrate utilization transcriptional regulator [Periweissella beninensis]MCM2437986.1 MurR/RpiR family transcriptional regulator [Periweissella beninensis]MCT4396765.1 MurR/RpiR family transcriptional regulator [Periweissella beninensis]